MGSAADRVVFIKAHGAQKISKESVMASRPPLLISFLGFPGSGKTYFAKRLATKLPAIVLNSDALRLEMFGSVERIEQIRQTDRSRLYQEVFAAMNYAARQTLRTGYSVIYDAQSTKRRDRQGNERLASEAGGLHVLVWIKTSPDVAKLRGQKRAADDDSHQYTAEKMDYLVDRFERVTDLPGLDENVVEISGEITFDEQYQEFIDGIEKIYAQTS